MAKINIPPTRSNLLRMKQDLRFAREGYEILNRKREVLTGELIRIAHEAEVLQVELWKLLAAAYRAMEQAQLQRGRENVEWAALAAKETLDVQLKFRGIMGVAVPVVEASTRQQDAFSKSDYPVGSQLCAKCSTSAVVMMDGCMTCLNCGDSKCG